MSTVSVIIPVSEAHATLAADAVASAYAQTVACEVIVEYDHDETGAAATRNRALARATGDFIVPLDADDLLMPHFVEMALERWRPGCYVVTDHVEAFGADRRPVVIPDAVNWNAARAHHYVTALYPRGLLDDGFDVTAVIEDQDLQMRARWRGWKCVNAHRPAWIYRRTLGQSVTSPFRNGFSEIHAAGRRQMHARYPGIEWIPALPGAVGFAWGNPRAGMLPAHALFEPRRFRGQVTGVVYDVDDYGRAFVYPQDAETNGVFYFAFTEDVLGLSPIAGV